MPGPIPFTENYQDLSTDKGFQFKFLCDRCGSGYMSTFQYNTVGVAGEALRAAGDLFGGFFGRASETAYDIQRAVGGPAHDAALRKAVDELRPRFYQCPRCGTWVCKDVCWNDGREQCVQCSPKMEQEIKAIESEATVYQIRNKAMQDEGMAGGVQLHSAATEALCPSCHSPIEAGKKFCGECGANLAAKPKCPQCGTEAEPGKKFCAECGTKL